MECYILNIYSSISLLIKANNYKAFFLVSQSFAFWILFLLKNVKFERAIKKNILERVECKRLIKQLIYILFAQRFHKAFLCSNQGVC